MEKNKLKLIQSELEKNILNKLDLIKDNILTGKGKNEEVLVEILLMVDDELSDVLLNWDDRIIDNGIGKSELI